MIQVEFYNIRKWAYIYMALPIICFVGLYVNSIWCLTFTCLGILALVNICKGSIEKHIAKIEPDIVISRWNLLFLISVAIVWAYLGGQGNIFFQNSDWDCRNAIYRDLIYQEWPVIYEDFDKALVYYIGYWLPTATIVKILGNLFPVILESEMAFGIGNILLWIWTSIGIFLIELLLLTCVKPKDKKGFYIVVTILVIFSGLDIVGALAKVIFLNVPFKDSHIEWWTAELQYSSLTTCLFWVFNQAVISWMAILCLIQEKTVRDYVFLGACVFAVGPIPFLGIFVYMIVYAINYLIKSFHERKIIDYFREIFSCSNICSLIVFVPLIMYYMSNMAISVGVKDESAITFLFFKVIPINRVYLIKVVLFWIIEVGIYFILLYKSNKNNLYYWTSIVITIIAPFFKMGTASDFVMRSTIPTIMLISVMCMQYLVNQEKLLEKRIQWFNKRFCYSCLIISLSIGSVTALSEITRGYNKVMECGEIVLVNDNLKTLNKELDGWDKNFVAYEYDNKLFFRYFS